MSSRLYRALLYLLPRQRRERYGVPMEIAFADILAHADGPFARATAWMNEVKDLVGVSAKGRLRPAAVRLRRAFPGPASRMPSFGSHLRWAWRAVRARGWRAAVVVSLLAMALAANALAFAAADSFVFHRVEYPHADRLVELGRKTAFDSWSAYGSPQAIRQWRSATDIFTAVYAYGSEASAYVPGGPDGTRIVRAAAVEPGLLELLGARPVAGRLFVAGDRQTIIDRPNGIRWFAPQISVISESLAREVFGSAAAAIGRPFVLGTYDTTVVGVVDSQFRFPTGAEQIWTPFELAQLLPNQGAAFLAQLAHGVTQADAVRAVRDRSPAVEAAEGFRRSASDGPLTLRAFAAGDDARQRQILWLLMIAAGCLLLIACANVVNLELASAIQRARSSAIALALGASPGALVAGAMAEGAIVLAAAAAGGAILAWFAIRLLTAALPVSVSMTLANPLDLDARATAFMAAMAALTWLVTTVPVALVTRRVSVAAALRLESRSASGSRGTMRLRGWLTTAEVALSVVLLIGALTASQSYSSLLAIPKGFQVRGVVGIEIVRAPRATGTADDLQPEVLKAVRGLPFVSYAGAVTANPPERGGAINAVLTVNGASRGPGRMTASGYGVEPEYFQAMGLPIVRGRAFTRTDPPRMVVIDEAFARKVWPNGDAIGATFSFGKASLGAGGPDYEVVGIAAHMRNGQDVRDAISDTAFPLYYRLDGYAPLSFVARLSDEARIADIRARVQALAPASRVRVERITDRYARAFSNEMLAAGVMNVFGMLALCVAAVGVYSVMAFVVASRTREIGIRMAVGADRGTISRMIVGASARLVIAGAAIGVGLALGGARWFAPLLFGVSARDPIIYGVVGLIVVGAALVAAWRPAFVAARVDPSLLLRE